MTATLSKVAFHNGMHVYLVKAPAVAAALTRRAKSLGATVLTLNDVTDTMADRVADAFAGKPVANIEFRRNALNWFVGVTPCATKAAPVAKPASQRAAEKAEATVFDTDTSVAGTHTCGRCAGTGLYIVRIENDKPVSRGACYRCKGKGVTSDIDRRRNLSYDQHSAGKLTA